MKNWQNATSIVMGGLVLLLTLTVVGISISNQNLQKSLQEQVQQQQSNISQGQLSQQIGTALVKDMAALSVNNPKLKDLLAKYGIKVNVNQNGNSASSGTH